MAQEQNEFELGGWNFRLYIDNRSMEPKVVLRINTKTFDKGISLQCDQIEFLGQQMVSCARKAKRQFLTGKGLIAGRL